MAKLTTPVLCIDPSKEMLEVVEKMGDFSNTLVSLMVISVDKDIIKVYITMINAFQDLFSESLEAGRCIFDTKGHTEELVQPPRGIHT